MTRPLLCTLLVLGCASRPTRFDPPAGEPVAAARDALQAELAGTPCTLTRSSKGLVEAECTPAGMLPAHYRYDGGRFEPTDLIGAQAVLAQRAAPRGAKALGCPLEEVQIGLGPSHVQVLGCGGTRHYTATCDGQIHEWGPPPGELEGSLTDAATPPKAICQPPLRFPAGFKAPSEGLVKLKCRLTAEGFLEHCAMENPIEGLDAVLYEQAYGSRYEPARMNGKPAAVDYVINVELRGNK